MIPGLDPDTARRLVDAYREARFSGTPEGRKRAEDILAEIRAGRYLKPIDWEALVAEERKRLYPDEASPPAQPAEPEPEPELLQYRSLLGAEELTPLLAQPDTDRVAPSMADAPSPTPRPIPARVPERTTPDTKVLHHARRAVAQRRIAPAQPRRQAPQRRAMSVEPLPRLEIRLRPELISGAERFPMVWRRPRR